MAPVGYATGLKDILQKAGVSGSEQSAPVPKLDTQTTTEQKANSLINSAIQLLLILAGIIGVVLVTWGGFRYATSFGEKGGLDNAKKVIIGAITGLLVVIFSYAILTNVIHFVETAG